MKSNTEKKPYTNPQNDYTKLSKISRATTFASTKKYFAFWGTNNIFVDCKVGVFSINVQLKGFGRKFALYTTNIYRVVQKKFMM